MMEIFIEQPKCIVNTKDGPVCGFIDESHGETHYTFKSIPYGRPPVGNLRFLPPVPVKPWTETIDCTQESPLPLSYNGKEELVGSEDCLYLEVTSPNIKPEKPLPVMFWIGSYCFSQTLDQHYEPSLITNEGVVFVRCGFRLGPFGFLSTNDFVAPGNCGLKDIVLALKWVQNNIAEFGGDQHNVTIFGSSTGGAAVHLLLLSPMASGLFHKAIIQSASALSKWSLDRNPIQSTMELVKELGITKPCIMDIIEELRTVPAKDIMAVYRDLKLKIFKNNESHLIEAFFKPCIEQEFEGQPAFLTRSPLIILKSGNFNKVPVIIGSNNIEAAVLHCLKHDFYDDFEKYNENVHLIVPRSLVGDEKITTRIGHQLLDFYLDGEASLRKDTRSQYLQLITDYYFLFYIYKTVQLHRQFAPECPIYYYVVNHTGEWLLPEEISIFNSVGHGAEIPFIFGLRIPGMTGIFKGSRDSVRTRQRVVKMWTNFAKFGDPTPDEDDPLLQIKWDPVENKDKLNYLSIGSELTKGRNPFHERMQFWEELHKEYMFLRVLVYFNDVGIMW